MRVLFLPDYSEPLKVFLPLIDAVRKRGHEARILNIIRGVSDTDRAKVDNILEQRQEKADYLIGPDQSDLSLVCGIPKLLWRILDRVRLVPALRGSQLALRAEMQRMAKSWLNSIEPDVLVVANDHIDFLSYFIDVAHSKGIPSVCYQWNIGNVSVRHAKEMLERFSKVSALSPPPVGAGGALERSLKAVGNKYLDSYEAKKGLRIQFPTPYYGGGNATKFAVIGKGCFDAYVAMGTDPNKMVVTGYPIYEELYHEAEQARANRNPDQRRRLGLPVDAPLFLWCTNDQRTYYEHDYTYEQMLDSWIAIRDLVFRVNPEWHLVIKIHPKERAADYWPLVRDEPRATLIEDCDVWQLIAECDCFLTRFSSTAVSALCLAKPTLTCNYPKVPGGTLYEDIGGTLHANTLEELEAHAQGLAYDPAVQAEATRRREVFIRDYIDIRDRPAADRFVDLLEELEG